MYRWHATRSLSAGPITQQLGRKVDRVEGAINDIVAGNTGYYIFIARKIELIPEEDSQSCFISA